MAVATSLIAYSAAVLTRMEWVAIGCGVLAALIVGLLAASTPRARRRFPWLARLPVIFVGSPTERLRQALKEGTRLRSFLLMEGQGRWEEWEYVRPKPLAADKDPLYLWARSTYDLLQDHFEDYADEFFGEHHDWGSPYFGYSFTTETASFLSRRDYLERRVDLLKTVLKAVR